MSAPPPGWHPDPSNPAYNRWWDGQKWTSATQPAYRSTPPPAPTLPPTKPRNWKRTLGITLVGIAAAWALLAGCNRLLYGPDDDTATTAATSSTTTAAAAPPAPRTTPKAAPRNTADDRRYLAQITDPAVRAGNTDDDLLYLADSICLAADGGATNTELTENMLDAGFRMSQAVEIISAARSTYCPRE